ncbi:MAG TPA: ATP-binding protein [Pyrinomonadaceae bacterium]|nr:ATP-binding protein [Pyrinomonadaceae bacterium]
MDDVQKQSQQDTEPRVRRRGAPWLLGGLVLLLLSVLVLLQVFGLWEIFTPDTASDTLLLYALSSLNFVAFFVFTFIFVRNLLKLRRERRERLLGSKIKTRLVVYFIAVSLLPITAMAVFSYMFFNRSLEKWFSFLPEAVVRQAREVQRSEELRQLESLKETSSAIALVYDAQADAAPVFSQLPALAERGKLALLAIVPATGERPTDYVAPAYAEKRPVFDALIRRALTVGGGDSAGAFTDGQFNVALIPLNGDRRLVAARERVADANLATFVAGAQTFDDFRKNQRKVRLLGLSTLGLLTLMLLFAATWSAIHLARGIGAPIRALAEAARQIAGGNLDYRVTAIADDELAVLAASFNDMTAQLAESRRHIEGSAAELRDKNLALAERRDYIETVLQTLSTGVISLDEENRVTTINAAALAMLRPEHAPPAGTPLSEIVGAEDYAVLARVLWRARLRGRESEQVELARGPSTHDGDGAGASVIPVALTATALSPREGEQRRGVVLVIEDLTELLTAQRAAAWSEVARRMAHEIKNPLTPIQLSAERIARNFRRAASAEAVGAEGKSAAGANGHSNGQDSERVARLVEECTATISREVAGLKAMVDEFSRFARLPHARLQPGDLNEVVRQAVALYEDRLGEARIDVRLAHTLPGAMLDAEQIRRVFVNLIDNSIEALADADGERRITIATAHDPARGLLLAEVADTGHGIARSDLSRLFQPYFSTRGRGTGLGLAIVQRIVAEHGGRIRPEQNRPHGARMIVELPVADDTQERG